jgi:hypothetical protein
METKPTNMRLNPLDHVATIDRVSAGMWVWSIDRGWAEVGAVDRTDDRYPIKMKGNCYTAKGMRATQDANPSLFLVDIFEGTSPPAPEVDWEKVPYGTKVEVCNTSFEDKLNGIWRFGEFLEYKPSNTRKYRALIILNDCPHVAAMWFDHCRLACEPKPEWMITPEAGS